MSCGDTPPASLPVSSLHVLVILITHLMCCLPRHQQTRFICKDIKKMRDLCTRPALRIRNIFWVKQNKTLTRFILPKMGLKHSRIFAQCALRLPVFWFKCSCIALDTFVVCLYALVFVCVRVCVCVSQTRLRLAFLLVFWTGRRFLSPSGRQKVNLLTLQMEFVRAHTQLI